MNGNGNVHLALRSKISRIYWSKSMNQRGFVGMNLQASRQLKQSLRMKHAHVNNGYQLKVNTLQPIRFWCLPYGFFIDFLREILDPGWRPLIAYSEVLKYLSAATVYLLLFVYRDNDAKTSPSKEVEKSLQCTEIPLSKYTSDWEECASIEIAIEILARNCDYD
uniref:Uncharacterized protein n=1 Tax=Glossina palpalis gambiensis TaxID=67801 RepID=A0A1B0AW94_9MUSC